MQVSRLLREHEHKVERVARDIRHLVERSESLHLKKGGVAHGVPRVREPLGRPLDLTDLDALLAIDPEGRTCTTEPGVDFARLVEATLAHDLLPTVVPELEGITVGGAVAGCSVESSSFRYGGLHDGCVEYEVVTGTGEVKLLSRTRDPRLFDMVHGSYGTLAVLTRVTLTLVPAAPFVELDYVRFGSGPAFFAALRDAVSRGDADFIDGIVHGPHEAVLCLGRFAASARRASRYGRARPYYRSTRELDHDVMTTRDYVFRYDADCHWLSRTLPPLEWPIVRRLVGRFVLGSTNLIRWSERLRPLFALQRRPPVVCDVFIPARRFLDFFAWYERSFAHWPLWVVPYRVPGIYPWISTELGSRMQDDLFIDCAIYGKPNRHPEVDASEVLEARTYAHDGLKTLIGRNHYTRERFWEIYNEPAYRAAKRELDPRGLFPDLYDKMVRPSPASAPARPETPEAAEPPPADAPRPRSAREPVPAGGEEPPTG